MANICSEQQRESGQQQGEGRFGGEAEGDTYLQAQTHRDGFSCQETLKCFQHMRNRFWAAWEVSRVPHPVQTRRGVRIKLYLSLDLKGLILCWPFLLDFSFLSSRLPIQ